MSIRMRIRAGYITIISAYAPTFLTSIEDVIMSSTLDAYGH